MTILHLILLSLVQGITEFLPISSSGHLILLPIVTGMEDQGLLMDVSVHVGTLAAVLLYFREDTKGLTLAALGAIGVSPARRAIEGTQYAKLFWALVLATIPTVIVGGIFAVSGIEEALRSATIIAATSILFGILLYWADKRGSTHLDMAAMKLKPALIIGFAQVLALIPGTSRAGITMTAARYLGFNRVDAARFSMLLSIPTILAAGTLGALKLVSDGNPLALTDAAIGAGLSCLAALVAIHFLMRWLTHATMTIFVIYRVGLGLALFAMIGAGWF